MTREVPAEAPHVHMRGSGAIRKRNPQETPLHPRPLFRYVSSTEGASRMSRCALLIPFTILLLAPSLALAQIELSGGYSNLHLGGADQNLHNADGFGLDLRVGGSPIPLPVASNFRLGVD